MEKRAKRVSVFDEMRVKLPRVVGMMRALNAAFLELLQLQLDLFRLNGRLSGSILNYAAY